MDFSINQVRIRDVVGTNAAFQPTVSKQVTFYVGTDGPFHLTYHPAEITAERIRQDMQKQVELSRAIHAAESSL
jgi:hypothetical protein